MLLGSRFLLLWILGNIFKEGNCGMSLQKAVLQATCSLKCRDEPACLTNCTMTPKNFTSIMDAVLPEDITTDIHIVCRDNSSVVFRGRPEHYVIGSAEIDDYTSLYDEWTYTYDVIKNNGTELIMGDLSPGKIYLWSIHRVHPDGVFESIYMSSITTMTDDDQPARITNVRMRGLELDTIDGMNPGWQLGLNFDYDRYPYVLQVTCQQDNGAYKSTIETKSQSTRFSVKFRLLPFGANFTVSVTVPTLPCRLHAKHQETILTFSTPRCVYSLPHPRDCLPEPANDFNATATYKVRNIFDVRVTWDPPNVLPDVYIVDLHPIGVERLNPVSKTVPKDNVDTIFSNVKMLEEFEVNVRASNKFGDGPKTSRRFTIPHTPIDGTAPSPVWNLKAVTVDETSGKFKVSWTPDNSSTQDSYVLLYDEVDRPVDDTLTYLFVNTTEVILDPLLPGRKYFVSVRALSNKAESIESIIHIVTRPATPIFDDLKSIEKGLIISWKSGANSKQDNFKVNYIMENGKSATTSTTEWKVHLEDLYPGVKYDIQVIAISHGLTSDPVSRSATVPPHRPENLRILEVTADLLFIQWKAPRDSMCSDFFIKGVIVEEHEFLRTACLGSQLNSLSCISIIRDLTSGESYTIQVVTVSYDVESLESAQINHTQPPKPVMDIVSTSYSTTVTLEWWRPKGRIETYVITWWPVENSADIHTKNVTESHVSASGMEDSVPKRKELISDLTPSVEYSFSIYTVSHNRVSKASNFTTKMTPAVVEGLKAIVEPKMGNTFDIHVSWDRPESIPDFYIVNITFNSSDTTNTISHNVSGSANETIFSDVEISEEFNMHVAAWSSAGEGSVTSRHFQKPQTPVRQIAPAVVEGLKAIVEPKMGNTFDIHVSWDRPESIPDFYIVNITFNSSDTTDPVFYNISGSASETLFSDVEISEEFNVHVAAWSSAGEGPVTSRHFQKPQTPVRQIDIWIPLCLAGGISLVIGIALYGYLRFRKRRLSQSRVVDQFEISPKRLDITRVLGNGAFGVVKLGTLRDDQGNATTVAVKMLKDDSNENDQRNFRAEIDLMKTLDKHPNVISLLGCCSISRYPFLVIEFCALGDLYSFLRKSVKEATALVDEMKKSTVFGQEISCTHKEIVIKNSDRSSTSSTSEDYVQVAGSPENQDTTVVTVMDMLNFGHQIARGMEFLSSKRVVHRDLATRNVLVSFDRTVKISDFGLSRDIYQEKIYTKSGIGRMPLRWMAIEALTHQVYTTYSDVWSFGILLWEIVTLGGNPYPGIPAIEILKRLQSGYRMERPENCSVPLYDLMLSCWRTRPMDRPPFTILRQELDKLICATAETEYFDLNDESEGTPSEN